MKRIKLDSAVCYSALALALALMPNYSQAHGRDRDSDRQDEAGAVFTMDNAASANHVQAYPALRFDFDRLYPGVRSCVLECRSINSMRTAGLMEFDERGKVRRVLAHYHDEAAESMCA